MPEVTLKAYEAQIDQMIDESRYIESLAHVRHLLSQYPRYIGAYYLLGKAMLEADQPDYAIDLFRRALNANPEHLVSRIGLGLAHQKRDELDAAIWNLERAFELEPGSAEIAEELRHIYGARDGVIPDSIALSRAGLARMYIRAQRYDRAASELEKLVDKNPNRPDLMMALAEAYWRAGQIVQASEAGQQILDNYPYNIKANLLMASLWGGADQEESQLYLQRAADVDPEGEEALKYMGADSPLPAQELLVDRLAYDPAHIDVDAEARWYRQLDAMSIGVGISEAPPDMSDTEVRLVDITAGLESQIEIPDWLRDMGSAGTALEETASENDLGWMLNYGDQKNKAPGELINDALSVSSFDEPVVDQVEAIDWNDEAEPVAVETAAVDEQSWDTLLPAGDQDLSPDWLSEMQSDGAIDIVDDFADFADLTEESESDLVENILDVQDDLVETPETAEGDSRGLDWLYGDDSELESSKTEDVDDDALDWLHSVVLADKPATEPPDEFPDAHTGLDWLPDDVETTPDLPEPEPALFEMDEETDIAAEDTQAVDWLASLPSAEDEVEIQIPEAGATGEVAATKDEDSLDWLSGFAPVTAETADAADEVALADAPDWLRELRAPEPAVPETSLVDFADAMFEDTADAASPEDFVETDELPDWMRDFSSGDVKDDSLDDQAATAAGDVPDWLAAYAPAQKAEVEESETEDGVDMFGWQSFGGEAVEIQPASEPVAHAESALPQQLEEEAEKSGFTAIETDQMESLDWLQDISDAAPADATLIESPETSVAEAAGVLLPEAVEDTAESDFMDLFAADEIIPEPESETSDSDQALAELFGDAEGDTDLSGENALAWLESLADSEKAELHSQAEEPETILADVAEEPVVALEDASEEDGMMSGADALAWLASLSAGKEEELRAEAEAEQEARLAELLGRRKAAPAVEAEVEQEPDAVEDIFEQVDAGIVETVLDEGITFDRASVDAESDAAGPVDAEALASGDMMSGADALAWLASLSAGKEEELRAEAEAEQEARLAELLGRKKAAFAVETGLAQEPDAVEDIFEQVDAGIVETVLDEGITFDRASAESDAAGPVDAEALASGDMMSGADALSWLASLSAGKEDELRARADAEQEARVAELLGHRKPEPAAEPDGVDGVDGVDESEPEEIPGAEDPLFDAAVMVEENVEEESHVEELLGRPVEEVLEAATHEDYAGESSREDVTGVFAWDSADVEDDALGELVEDVLPERAGEAVFTDGFEGIFEEDDLVEEVSQDIPDVDTLVEELTDSEPEPDTPMDVIGDVVVEQTPDQLESPTATGAPVVPEVTAEPEPVAVVDELDEMRNYLKRKRSDHPARLNFSRALWEAGDRTESLEHYARLIKSGALMEEVLSDLKQYEEQGKEAALVLRAIGDAYMKQGDLDTALSYFNRALSIT